MSETSITFLGCGTSGGVPLVGNRWGACNPDNPKNSRRRSSIFIEHRTQNESTRLLIDATPDARLQLLDANITEIDALLITHCHADHIAGLDDLRGLNNLMHRPINLYAQTSFIDILTNRFPYAFEATQQSFYSKPSFKSHALSEEQGIFTVNSLAIHYFKQKHGAGFSTAFRFGNWAYCTDVSDYSTEDLSHLAGIDVWIVDCLRPDKPHPSHAALPQILEWNQIIKPREIYLTHLGIESDYDALNELTPTHIKPAWDGLVIKI